MVDPSLVVKGVCWRSERISMRGGERREWLAASGSVAEKDSLFAEEVEGAAGDGELIGDTFQEMARGIAGSVAVVGGIEEDAAGEVFVVGKVWSAVAAGALMDPGREEAGEDEELIAGLDLEVEAEAATGRVQAGDDIGGVGVAARKIAEWVFVSWAEALGDGPCDVVGEVVVLKACLEEGMANENVEIERWGNVDGGGGIDEVIEESGVIEKVEPGGRIGKESEPGGG